MIEKSNVSGCQTIFNFYVVSKGWGIRKERERAWEWESVNICVNVEGVVIREHSVEMMPELTFKEWLWLSLVKGQEGNSYGQSYRSKRTEVWENTIQSLKLMHK